MTAPTDSRAEARALMRRVEKDKGKWAYVNHVRPLLAALEAALEREARLRTGLQGVMNHMQHPVIGSCFECDKARKALEV